MSNAECQMADCTLDEVGFEPSAQEALAADDNVRSFQFAVSARALASDEEADLTEVAKGYTPFLPGDLLVAKITPCFETVRLLKHD